MAHHTLRHYKTEHYEEIEKADTYEKLCDVAIDVLKSMPKPIVTVCGPISTGGAGNIKANLEIFEKTIHKLSNHNNNIFNQMPFEKSLQVIRERFGSSIKEQNQILLDKFYLPIYSSGLITKMYFIHGWESSHGARWEREIAKENNISIEDLPKDFLDI